MKVLFVSSGRKGFVSPLIKNQGDSLAKLGIDIDYIIIQSGFFGYIKGIKQVRSKYLSGKYDIIHAHYLFCGIIAGLAGKFPLVVSLLGSDAFKSKLWLFFIRIFNKYRWDATIVKTQEMKNVLKLNNLIILPNGVDTEKFKPINRKIARKKLNIDNNKKIAVFISDPNRREKNYCFAVKVIEAYNNKYDKLELLVVNNIDSNDVPLYINAANLLVLTSDREGSVNVIKEAMSCNLPFVSTNVGDVLINANGVKGCFISDKNISTFVLNIKKALESDLSEGRSRIFELGLDADMVAKKIIKLYEQIAN